MSLYDSMHPRARAAIANAPFHFDLLSMPQTAINWAIGSPACPERHRRGQQPRPCPGRFILWLNGEIEAVRKQQASYHV